MIELNKRELLEVNGGGINFGLIFGLSAGISFLIGIIDGYVRPLKCN